MLAFFLDARNEQEGGRIRRRREKEEKKMWIRREADPDGYFLLQHVKKVDYNDMFLTAENVSSLMIARK